MNTKLFTLMAIVAAAASGCEWNDSSRQAFSQNLAVTPSPSPTSTPTPSPTPSPTPVSRAANTSCIPPANSGDIASKLSDTGCFDTTVKAFKSGVFAYDINATLWTDGAKKSRAFAIPDNSLIEVSNDGDFIFPGNTVLIKNFLNNDTYLETRLLINFGTEWKGFSYEWNDAQTDADLLSAGKTKDVGEFVHVYPSSDDCNRCHTADANNSLGIELAQLNRVNEQSKLNFIDHLNQAGYFKATNTSTDVPKLYALTDAEASIDRKARSYLHANCSGCHRNGAFLDLRYSTKLADMNICDVDATGRSMGLTNPKRIAAGNPDASVLLLRMATTDAASRMPPLGTLKEDTTATAMIRNWISGLTSCQ